MANRIEGVHERILGCARVEFLEKGFKDASLRTIAQNADTSTSSIYTRFSDKEGLFEALVGPVLTELKDWFIAEQENFHRLAGKEQQENKFLYGKEHADYLVNYIYRYFDLFRILVLGSDGTKYAGFINDFVEIDTEYTLRYLDATRNDALVSGRTSRNLIHILSSAYYSGLFEIVIHDMTREDAYIYVKQLRRFFMCGWQDVFTPMNLIMGGDEEWIQ